MFFLGLPLMPSVLVGLAVGVGLPHFVIGIHG